ncbi:MAG: HdeD family acid-resistance protein [Bacteroidota bacterium]
METRLLKKWTFTAFKGALAIVFGLIAVFNPEITLTTIIRLFGIFALVGGLFLFAASLINRPMRTNSGFWLLEGSFDVIIGILFLVYPEAVAALFAIFIGIWALFTGIMLLLTYKRLKHVIFKRWLLLINGGLSMIIGLLLLFNPFEGSQAIIILFGIYAIIYGLTTVFTSIEMNKA